MKLNTDEIITAQLACKLAIASIKQTLTPDMYKYTSLRLLTELQEKLDSLPVSASTRPQ